MTDIVERLTDALPSSADIWEAKREIESLRQQLAECRKEVISLSAPLHFEQQLAECQAALKLAEEGLTVAYMSGFHDGKKKGGREALLEAAWRLNHEPSIQTWLRNLANELE